MQIGNTAAAISAPKHTAKEGKVLTQNYDWIKKMAQMHFPLSISAILIDLDGTLLHTAPELAEAANRMLRDMGRPAVSGILRPLWV